MALTGESEEKAALTGRGIQGTMQRNEVANCNLKKRGLCEL